MRLLIVFIFLTLLTPLSHAGIRPSFNPDWFAWQATHIVLVTEGDKIDGEVTILESWLGDLKPGDTLKIPELAKYTTEESRLIKQMGFLKPAPQVGAPLHVTCKRMVLFLRKASQVTDPAYYHTVEGTSEWFACGMGYLYASIAWFDHGKTYAFVQWSNPGESDLIEVRGTEASFKEHIFSELKMRKICEDAGVNPETASRLPAAQSFASSCCQWEGSVPGKASLAVLASGAPDGLNIVRKLLKDDTFRTQRNVLLAALAYGGGTQVAPEIANMLEAETAFWRETGPTLKEGWRDGVGFDKDAPESQAKLKRICERKEYSDHVLEVLQKMDYPVGGPAIMRFQSVWNSVVPSPVDREAMRLFEARLRALLPKAAAPNPTTSN